MTHTETFMKTVLDSKQIQENIFELHKNGDVILYYLQSCINEINEDDLSVKDAAHYFEKYFKLFYEDIDFFTEQLLKEVA